MTLRSNMRRRKSSTSRSCSEPSSLRTIFPASPKMCALHPRPWLGSIWARLRAGMIPNWSAPIRASLFRRMTSRIVFRTDGSGTTYVWTDYLSKISDIWLKRVRPRNFDPISGRSAGVQYNEGVRDLIKREAYSDRLFAGDLRSRRLLVQVGLSSKTRAGTFVKADVAGITAASTTAATNIQDDFRPSITNATGPDVYPISSLHVASRSRAHRRPGKETGR